MNYRAFMRNRRLLDKRYEGTLDSMNGVAKCSLQTPAGYHLKKQLMRVMTFPVGHHFTICNIHLEQLPKMVLRALVVDLNLQGIFTTNPFNFVHKNITQMLVDVDTVFIPTKPYSVVFATDEHQRPITIY